MTVSELWKKAVFYLTVPKCVCCRKALSFNDNALCASCRIVYENSKKRDCGTCFKPIVQCHCAPSYLNTHFVHELYKVTRYIKRQVENPSNALVYSLKEDYRGDTVSFMASELSDSLSCFQNQKDIIVTNVPRRKRGIQKYGYDHAALLAKETAKQLHLPYLATMKSKAKTAQKNLRGIERKINADFSLKSNINLDGKRVILIDDIVTTGSSMGSAAMCLKGAKASKVIGACFAIAYLDKNPS